MTFGIQLTTTGETNLIEANDNFLEVLQKNVGGYVEAIQLTDGLTLWCNEEGKLNNLPHNRYAQVIWDSVFGEDTDFIVGDVVLTAGEDSDGNTEAMNQPTVEGLLTLVELMRETFKDREEGNA